MKTKSVLVFLIAGISGVTRNSSPVYVSSIEALMTGWDWMKDPGDPFPSSVPALLFSVLTHVGSRSLQRKQEDRILYISNMLLEMH